MRIKEFIFKQKCLPWRIIVRLKKYKSFLFNPNTQCHWDNWWSSGYKSNPEQVCYPNLHAAIVKIIPNGASVLDIGCGIGILMERLKNEKKCNVFGLDISKIAIEEVNKKGMPGIVANVNNIPFPSNTFDVVIATEVLEHLRRPKNLFKQIIKILKDSGLFIVSTPYNALGPEVLNVHLRTYNISSLKEVISFNSMNIKIEEIKENGQSFSCLLAYGCKSIKNIN